jgi:hypothetical protein
MKSQRARANGASSSARDPHWGIGERLAFAL